MELIFYKNNKDIVKIGDATNLINEIVKKS